MLLLPHESGVEAVPSFHPWQKCSRFPQESYQLSATRKCWSAAGQPSAKTLGGTTYLWKEEIDEWDAEDKHDTEQYIDLPASILNRTRSHQDNHLDQRS